MQKKKKKREWLGRGSQSHLGRPCRNARSRHLFQPSEVMRDCEHRTQEAEAGRLHGRSNLAWATDQDSLKKEKKKKKNQGAVVYACNPSTWKVKKGQRFKAILSYTRKSRLAGAT